MKIFTFIIAILISNALYGNSVHTTLQVNAPATEKQVKIAILILEEALEAKNNGDENTYKEKIDKSKVFLQTRQVKVTYKAQMKCNGKVVEEWEDAVYCEYNVGHENLCFKGDVKIGFYKANQM